MADQVAPTEAEVAWNNFCDYCGIEASPAARIALAKALISTADDPTVKYTVRSEWREIIEQVIPDERCTDCGGHGADPMSDNVNWLPCRKCQGTGRVRKQMTT